MSYLEHSPPFTLTEWVASGLVFSRGSSRDTEAALSGENQIEPAAESSHNVTFQEASAYAFKLLQLPSDRRKMF